eukprot:scaffold3046_cov105-Cylindrotheca_fusiformis.AAC.12
MEESIVRCKTTAGTFAMKLNRAWSPNGYDRAVELFERHFYDGSHFFRVVKGFLVQFGISYSEDKDLQKFAKTTIPDDPPKGIKFKPGIISFAGSSDNSRDSHLFISYGSAKSLGTEKWETPIGEVIEGMENVEKFYSYGDMPPWGEGPDQHKIYSGPNYIADNFPKTDKFIKCRTERLNKIDDDDNKIKVVQKKDHVTDEEHFAAARAQTAKEAPDSTVGRLNSPSKALQGDNAMFAGVGGVLLLLIGIGLLILRYISSRQSKASKSS